MTDKKYSLTYVTYDNDVVFESHKSTLNQTNEFLYNYMKSNTNPRIGYIITNDDAKNVISAFQKNCLYYVINMMKIVIADTPYSAYDLLSRLTNITTLTQIVFLHYDKVYTETDKCIIRTLFKSTKWESLIIIEPRTNVVQLELSNISS